MSDGIDGGRLRRAAPLAALIARTVGEAAVVGSRGKLTGADSTEFHVRTAARYAELLGRSKGALMKAGQMLSYAAICSAVPPEFLSIYHTALARLRMMPRRWRASSPARCSSASSGAGRRAFCRVRP